MNKNCKKKEHFFSDGGCRPTNPGPGGYGWIEVVDNMVVNYQCGYVNNTTNNKMELTAVLKALEYIDEHFPQEKIIIYSDSAYAVQIANSWSYNWSKNNWRRAGGKPIENLELIQEIYNYYSKNFNQTQIKKIKGHADNTYNNLVDILTHSEEQFLLKLKKEKCNGLNL